MGHTLDTRIVPVREGQAVEIALPDQGGEIVLGRERLQPIETQAPVSMLFKDGVPFPMYSLVE